MKRSSSNQGRTVIRRLVFAIATSALAIVFFAIGYSVLVKPMTIYDGFIFFLVCLVCIFSADAFFAKRNLFRPSRVGAAPEAAGGCRHTDSET